jgi:MinD superfamily P-loop ATPase
MKIAIASGKGGTGKTSLVAALAALAGNVVLADCDVDAADLHLVTSPQIQRRAPFRAGHVAQIRQEKCIQCGICAARCRFDAVKTIKMGENQTWYGIDPISCEGCGVCVHFCTARAIDFPENTCGEWFVSQTRYGPMVHARLGIAEENSGKLVSLVRTEAKKIAAEQKLDLVLIDGSPGIGCPVIASITGASLALIVTEPTKSGVHDLERVVQLAHHFQIRVMVAVNKFDINEEITHEVEAYCSEHNFPIAGRIPYDVRITQAQLEGKSIVEYDNGPAASAVHSLWRKVQEIMSTH